MLPPHSHIYQLILATHKMYPDCDLVNGDNAAVYAVGRPSFSPDAHFNLPFILVKGVVFQIPKIKLQVCGSDQ